MPIWHSRASKRSLGQPWISDDQGTADRTVNHFIKSRRRDAFYSISNRPALPEASPRERRSLAEGEMLLKLGTFYIFKPLPKDPFLQPDGTLGWGKRVVGYVQLWIRLEHFHLFGFPFPLPKKLNLNLPCAMRGSCYVRGRPIGLHATSLRNLESCSAGTFRNLLGYFLSALKTYPSLPPQQLRRRHLQDFPSLLG
jgi:hypothetical protein